MKYNVENYVLFDGEIHQVLRVDNVGVQQLKTMDGGFMQKLPTARSKYFDVQPLPITPELLERLGFVAGTKNAGKMPCFMFEKWLLAEWDEGVWQVWRVTEQLRQIQFIHQLQNLFESIEEKPLLFK